MCAIYLKHGEELVAMVEQPYEAEAVLQTLLADYPNLLGGDEDSEARKRWLLVEREVGIAGEELAGDRWSVDHLFLDEEGIPTLVEVKRSSRHAHPPRGGRAASAWPTLRDRSPVCRRISSA